MGLEKLVGWVKHSPNAASSCGAADKPTACGTADKPTACGTACGAPDKK